jgi:hypothetical protein
MVRAAITHVSEESRQVFRAEQPRLLRAANYEQRSIRKLRNVGETAMHKFKFAIALAVLSIPVTAPVDRAEALTIRGQVLRIHLARTQAFRHRPERRYVYISPVSRSSERSTTTRAPDKVATTLRPVPRGTETGVRYVDSMGRIYDPAGMAWFDGGTRCWTGSLPWTFKNGSWFYGTSRWYKNDGNWIADAADPPAPVACHAVPAFAGVQPATQPAPQTIAGREAFEDSVGEKPEARVEIASNKSLKVSPPPDRVKSKSRRAHDDDD